MSIRRLSMLPVLLSACAAAPPEPPPGACSAGEPPVDVGPTAVAPLTHEPPGPVHLTGTVVVVEGVAGGSVLVIDDGATVHRFGLGSPANAPFEAGNTVTVAFDQVRDGDSFRTELLVTDPAAMRSIAYVRASGDFDVSSVVEATTARLGAAVGARRRCATGGGSCGRRGARWELVYPSGDPMHGAPLPDGGRLSINAWQLEDDDTAQWFGETCETPPRASISFEAWRDGPPPPEPPACTAPAAFPLGSFGAPVGSPAIVHSPAGSLEAAMATVVSVTTDPLTLVLDVAGVEHRIEVPLATDVPALTAGSAVVAELAVEAGGVGSGRETLTLRAEAGAPPLAYYTRARGWGWLRSSEDVGDRFELGTSLGSVCRFDGGGQCGRGIVVRELVVDGSPIREGESLVVGGDLRIRVHALSDDGDIWQDGDVCAIGLFVADAVDVVRVP